MSATPSAPLQGYIVDRLPFTQGCALGYRSASLRDWESTSGIKYLIEAGKAYLSGTRPDVEGDPKIHGKVAM